MKTDRKSKESTKLLLTIPPESNSTIFGIDFDPSGYSRKVELLNEGTTSIPIPLVKKVEINYCEVCPRADCQ